MKTTKRKLEMTEQWVCPNCNFPENFTHNCSMCGTYFDEIPETAFTPSLNEVEGFEGEDK